MQVQPLPTTPLPPTQRSSTPHNRPSVSPASLKSTSNPSPRKKKQSMKPIVVAVVALLLLGTVIAWQLLSTQIQSDKYQAVFLNNGQVYFGKLHGYYGSRPYMTDVHYFQANSQTAAAESNSSNQLLVKLGSEVHAPEGKLILSKDAILFVENLTENSKVTKAIENENKDVNSGNRPSGGSAN